ncbi:sodium:proton exchanger [Bacillus proteolyticus]|uniref:sodium:proton exchanger n=1 Tax=Bacillus proteolyticus TaxID=2026192 RepID=UPI0030F3CB15
MSNYYYDRSHKCCWKSVKNATVNVIVSLATNVYIRPLFRNANTDFIQVSALNQTDEPQTVTIAVQNYQDTCDGDIYPSYGYLCGELIYEGGSDIEVCNGNESGCTYCEPEGINQFVGPATFTIPPRQLYSVRVFIPADPLIPVEPIYVV